MFSIEEALVFGWQKTKQNSNVIFQVVFTLFVLQILSSVIWSAAPNSVAGVLSSIAFGFAGFVASIGLTLMSLRIAQGKHIEYKDIIPPFSLLWRYIVATLLAGLLVAGVGIGVF